MADPVVICFCGESFPVSPSWERVECPHCGKTLLRNAFNETVSTRTAPDLGQLLTEARNLITGDRQAAYGSPEDNFGRWSTMCAAHGIPLTPAQLAMVMALGKISREANAHKPDNIVDAAAYLALYDYLLPKED